MTVRPLCLLLMFGLGRLAAAATDAEVTYATVENLAYRSGEALSDYQKSRVDSTSTTRRGSQALRRSSGFTAVV